MINKVKQPKFTIIVKIKYEVPTMAEMMAQGKQPEVLFWVGAAGSFDDRAKKITEHL